MLLRITSARLQTVEIEDVSQIVVFTDKGDPCVLARDLEDGSVIAGHAAEPDFTKLLHSTGVRAHNPTVTR